MLFVNILDVLFVEVIYRQVVKERSEQLPYSMLLPSLKNRKIEKSKQELTTPRSPSSQIPPV